MGLRRRGADGAAPEEVASEDASSDSTRVPVRVSGVPRSVRIRHPSALAAALRSFFALLPSVLSVLAGIALFVALSPLFSALLSVFLSVFFPIAFLSLLGGFVPVFFPFGPCVFPLV